MLQSGHLPRNRLDQIINTAFAIKSEHSSLIQVADAPYVYRRKIELQTQPEAYPGGAYYYELYDVIEPRREKMGQFSESNAGRFYRATLPDGLGFVGQHDEARDEATARCTRDPGTATGLSGRSWTAT